MMINLIARDQDCMCLKGFVKELFSHTNLNLNLGLSVKTFPFNFFQLLKLSENFATASNSRIFKSLTLCVLMYCGIESCKTKTKVRAIFV